MPPKKKAAPAAPKPPEVPVYRWYDGTSYSQSGPQARGTKDPDRWSLTAGKWPNTEPVSVHMESNTGDKRIVRVSIGEVLLFASGDTPEAAALAGMRHARGELAQRLAKLDELIANPPPFPAKGGY